MPKDAPGDKKSASNADESLASLLDKMLRATRHGRFAEVEDVLRMGLPIDATDQHGNTLLTVACQNGNKRIAKLALRQGANINHTNVRVACASLDAQLVSLCSQLKGNTPLHYCYSFGYQELGDYLIDKGADVAVTNEHHMTPLEGLQLSFSMFDFMCLRFNRLGS